MKTVEKVIRDGHVAVLVSPGYGAGWSTWAHNTEVAERCMFDPDTVAWVENGKLEPRPDFEAKFGEDFYDGGADDLIVMWLPIGTRFRIQEYDGSESLWCESEYEWITA